MKLLYYISSHGYGHAVRSVAICNELKPDIHVIFKTNIPKTFFEKQLCRPFSWFAAEFDCGCVQLDGITVDITATLQRYAQIDADNEKLLEQEVKWVRVQKIDAIASDITPFAFSVASLSNIPSAAVTNFTWYDIYREYCHQNCWFMPILERMREQYTSATILLSLTPAMQMEYFKTRKDIPVVGRIGKNIRKELSFYLSIPDSVYIGLIYLGTWGVGGIDWKKLERFESWFFCGLTDLPGNPSNYRNIGDADFCYQDLLASVDLLIGKLGYCVTAECLLNGTPILYVPRDYFAEHWILEQAVKQWGNAIRLSRQQFVELRWDDALEMVTSVKRPEPLRICGTRYCARELESIL